MLESSRTQDQLMIAARQKVKERKYWLNQLSGEPGKASIYTDKKRTGDTVSIDAVTFQLKVEVFERLMRLSGGADKPLHVILLSALFLLLNRYTGTQDIIIGTTIYKQDPDSHLQFTNTILPLRNRLDGADTFKGLLLQTRQTVLEAVEHQSYPMEVLVKELNLPPAKTHFPLFEAALLLKNIQDENYLEGIKIGFLFSFLRTGSGIEGKLEYDVLLYERKAVQRMTAHFNRLLQSALENPGSPLAGLEMLSDREKKQLLQDFNDTYTDYPGDKTICQLFADQVKNTPDNAALVFADKKLTYKALNEKANQLARVLRRKGVEADTIVGLMMERSIEMITAIFGILKAGGAYLPIDPGMPEKRILSMMNDCGVSILLTQTHVIHKHSFTLLQGLQAVRSEPLFTASRPQILDIDHLPIPDRSLVNYGKYIHYIGQAPVKNVITLIGTRGCPYHCAYCHKIWPKKHVPRSAENMFEEIELFYDMGVRRFAFLDDVFNLDIKNSTKFFEMVIKKGLKVQFFFPSGIRGDILSEEYIDLMVEAGLTAIPLALETASSRLQKLMGKHLNIEKFRKSVEYFCKKHPGVILELYVMIGFPTETKEEALMTLDFIKSVKWFHFPYIFLLKIWENTDMAKLALENGVSREDILNSDILAYQELPDTLPFEKSFVIKLQADFLDEYFLSRERLRHVLPFQMKVMTEDEIVKKYDSYLPVDIRCFEDLLRFTGIKGEELPADDFVEEESMNIAGLNEKLHRHFPRHSADKNALRVLLLDLTRFFSCEKDVIYNVLEAPLGLMYLLTTLNREYGSRVKGKIAKSSVDFDSYKELKILIADFKPDVIGIRAMNHYKNFFHQTAALIRQWGFSGILITGGPYATSNTTTLLQDKNIDLVVIGEGEVTFIDLVGKILENQGKLPDERTLRQVAGIAFVPGRRESRVKFAREILLFDELEDRLAGESIHNPEPINQSVNLAYTIFTSGSTGKPKGTLTTHGNVIRVVKDTNYIDIAADDRVLQLSNYAFDGSVFDIYGALLNGSSLVILKEDEVFSLDRLANVIKREGITVFFVTTALFNLLVEMELECFKGVRKVLFGGERISVDHARQALAYMGRDRIIHVYGPTETTVYAAFYFINEIPGTAGTIPIGAPIANTTLYILDRYLQPLPVGIPGEIYIGGSGTARGYMNCQELTAEKFRRAVISHSSLVIRSSKSTNDQCPMTNDRLYRTGDLARWLPDGSIVFLSRLDYQVKIRGFRVEPGEIENYLLNHKDIKKAAVVVREKENQEKYLCAYVVARKEISSSQLREFLSRDLSEYMIPAHVIQLETIPLTVNGKVDRKALPLPEMERAGTYTPPGNEVERKVVEIWSEILGIEANAISIKANFFELGGHSLKAAALSAHLHKILGVNVPLGKIFQNPTVQELAAFINKAEKEKYAAIEPVEKKEYYPMSSAQKRLYVLQELEPGNTTYNIPYVLSGENIHIPRLEHAFKRLISRHESLRTSFHMLGEEPVQKIHDQVEFEIEYFGLTAEAGGTGGKIHHSSLIIQNFLRAFDLSKSPLIRVGLIKLEQKKCTLMLEMHHIISDGTSMTIFVNEFRAFYQGKELPSLNIQYKDYSQWQHNVKNRESLEKQEAFWLKQFEDNISVLNLPLDYPRPAVQGFEGDRVEFSLTPEETKHLKEVALAEDLTLYMMILAIFDILLSRLSGQEDIIVGTPVAGRNHPDLKPIIGMFVNTLALRNYPLGEKTFKQFLKEIREQTLEAFENREYPFEELVEKVPVARDTSRNPFFDVMFVLQNFEMQVEEMGGKHVPGMKLAPYEHESKTAKFDLLLSAVETREALFLSLEYCTILFRDNTIQRFTRYFKHIVTAVLENPGISISAIDIVPGEEKQTLLFEFNDTRQDYPEDKTIYQLFEDQVERTPDSAALVGSKSIQLTYMELNRKSVQLACLLQSKGVGPNTIVAIMTERSIEMVIGFFAVLKAGGAYLPIEPEYPQERVDYMLKDSNARVLVSELSELSELSEGIDVVKPGDLSEELPTHLTHPTHPAHLCYILYTSGSTGMPRGVMIEHRSVVNILLELFNRYPLLETDTYLFKTPVVFDVSVSELFGWYPGGGRLAILENGAEKDPQKILDTIEAYRVTHINFVPSMFASFLETLYRENTRKLTSLKYIFLAGEALPPEMVIRFRALNIHSGIRLENIYGPTEAAIYASYYSLHRWKGIGSIPIGKPLANVRLYILNAYYLLQPIGAAGELCIGGHGVAVGYLNQPGLTAAKFLSVFNRSYKSYRSYRTYFSKKLYRTGDLARWQSDGIIEFLGRKDHQVKVRGFRIELGEIESQLLKHKDIKGTAVLLHEDPSGDKFISAYYVSDRNVNTSELREYLLKYLPGYMVPSHFIPIGRIPLTPSGKIDRKTLPSPEIEITGSFIPPADEMEEKLADIWSQVLRIDKGKISVEANFFKLGGHSLKLTVVIAAIHKIFDVRLPFSEAFRFPSIRGLSKYIRGTKKEKFSPIYPCEKKEYYPLSSAQKRMYIPQQMDVEGTAHNMSMSFPMEGPMDIRKVEQTFYQLVQSHEILRTSFTVSDGEPVQKVHEPEDVRFKIRLFDLESSHYHDPNPTHLALEMQQIEQRFIRPFDLSKVPLFRVGLITLKGSNVILLVDLHHIICDGSSINIMKNYFMRLYLGKVLPPLRLQYRDFSQWQNSELRENIIKQQEKYWLNQFQDEIPIINLPYDYPRPLVRTLEGDFVDVQIDALHSGALKEIAAREGTTMFQLNLVLINILLSKITGQEDIIVGIVTEGRMHADLKNLIGVFINRLALRNFPGSEKTFIQFLGEVKEIVIKAFENQDYPFEELVAQLGIKRDAGRNPLFDIAYEFNTIENETGELLQQDSNQVRQEQSRQNSVISKYDVEFIAVEYKKYMLFRIFYDKSLFKRTTMETISSYLSDIISRVVENNHITINELMVIKEIYDQKLVIPREDQGDFAF